MIRYSEIVTRLKAADTAFGNNIGSTTSFATATGSSADISLPHAWVMPLGFKEVGSISYQETFPEQLIPHIYREAFTVVLCLDNSANRGVKDGGVVGELPIDQIFTIQGQLMAAFGKWTPSSLNGLGNEPGNIDLISGEYIDCDNKQLWYRFEFAVQYKIDDVSIPPEVLAKIYSLVGDVEPQGASIAAITTVNTRNPLTQDGLQPVASIDDDWAIPAVSGQ